MNTKPRESETKSEKPISRKKEKRKSQNNVYAFIIGVMLMIIILLVKRVYFNGDKLNNMKFCFTEYYYSQENLDKAMRAKLGDVYDEGSFENFDNYVYKLVFDDLNSYEPEKIAKYNTIFSKADSEKVVNIIEEPGAVEVNTDENGVCYIKLNDFTDGHTYKELMKYSDILKSSDKFVIDLRDNTGGGLDELSKILSLFYEKNEIVLTEVSDKNTVEYKSKTEKIIDFDRLVFLCSEETASSSEAMIFCMRSDFGDKVSAVGSKTYGKNFSFGYKKYDDGHVVIFVSSLMGNGAGETFDTDGITPDFEVTDEECYDFALNLIK